MKRFSSLVVAFAVVVCLSGCDVLCGEDQSGTQPRPSPTQAPQNTPVRQADAFDAVLRITGLACHDGEEDDYVTSSGQDEITFVYTLIETDPTGRVVRSALSAWGPYDVVRGDVVGPGYFETVSLRGIPLGHGLIVTLSLVEVEDYSSAQDTMDTINRYAAYVEFANRFNPEPYSKAAIEITADILYYAGIALDIVAWADGDDHLGDVVDVADTAGLVGVVRDGGGTWRNGWFIEGTNNTDDYRYEVAYVVDLTPDY